MTCGKPLLVVTTVGSIAIACSTVSLSFAQWSLLSDFDSLSLGDLGTQGGWTTTGEASAYQIAVDPSFVENQALRANGGGSDLNAYLPLDMGIDDGSTATLFFRMRNATGGDLVFGSSDVAAPAGWSDYEGYMRMRGGLIDVRDGGDFAAAGPYGADHWTNVWLVLDNQEDTTTLYASVGHDPAAELIAGDFRNGTNDPLVTTNLRLGGGQNGVDGYLDDVYLAPGRELSLPSGVTPIIPGDVNLDGNVNELDYAAIRDHFQQTVTTRGEGDLNADGKVNFVDFGEWKNHATAAAWTNLFGVPEPSCTALILVAVVLAVYPARRRT